MGASTERSITCVKVPDDLSDSGTLKDLLWRSGMFDSITTSASEKERDLLCVYYIVRQILTGEGFCRCCAGPFGRHRKQLVHWAIRRRSEKTQLSNSQRAWGLKFQYTSASSALSLLKQERQARCGIKKNKRMTAGMGRRLTMEKVLF